MNSSARAADVVPADGITTVIAESAADVPGTFLQQQWQAASAALYPEHLIRAAADRRWRCAFVLAWSGSDPAGMLALLQRRTAEFPDPVLDPRQLAPGIFGEAQIPASRYLLIGGGAELVSGAATAAAGPEAARQVRGALVEAAFRRARATGLTAAALYVREAELAEFLGRDVPRPHEPSGELATLHLPPGGMAGYLASLRHRNRSVVRRDWRRLDELGLRAAEVPALEIVSEAAPLVLAVRQRHGASDYPALVSYRLAQWAAEAAGDRVAFAVRSPADGRLLAASFGCAHGGVLELYEIGLAEDIPDRHLAYAETLVYGPLRYAARAGCTEIGLGLASTTPKRLRGAAITRTWAVAGEPHCPAGGRDHDTC